jgi:hypothetical protein
LGDTKQVVEDQPKQPDEHDARHNFIDVNEPLCAHHHAADARRGSDYLGDN